MSSFVSAMIIEDDILSYGTASADILSSTNFTFSNTQSTAYDVGYAAANEGAILASLTTEAN